MEGCRKVENHYSAAVVKTAHPWTSVKDKCLTHRSENVDKHWSPRLLVKKGS